MEIIIGIFVPSDSEDFVKLKGMSLCWGYNLILQIGEMQTLDIFVDHQTLRSIIDALVELITTPLHTVEITYPMAKIN